MEMEARARAEEAQRLHAQERALAEIEAKKRKGVPPWVFAVIGVLVIGGSLGVYYGVIKPQQVAAAALQHQLEEMQAEAQQAQSALEEAQRSGASEADLQRLRDELAQAQANQQAAASGNTSAIRHRSRSSSSGTSSIMSSTSSGCMG